MADGVMLEKVTEEAARALRALGEIGARDQLGPGHVELDYWSLTFPIRCKGPGGNRSYFIKIPKSGALTNTSGGVLYDESRSQGRAEFETLRVLWSFAQGHGLTAVRPLAYLDQADAILTDFVPAVELYEICRWAALGSRWNRARASDALAATGTWLRKFHDSQEPGSPIAEFDLRSEFLKRFEWLSEKAARPRLVRAIWEQLRAVPLDPGATRIVASLPEFEVRNVMVGIDGIYPVDTGEPRPRPPEADVARFVVSIAMIFWGSPLFLLTRRADIGLIRAFLDGYGRPNFGSKALDRWFLGLEWLRQWQDAYFVVDRVKSYPTALRQLIAWLYIDGPFSAIGTVLVSARTGLASHQSKEPSRYGG
jgi:hypothetical protein